MGINTRHINTAIVYKGNKQLFRFPLRFHVHQISSTACASSEGSDQHTHPHKLIRVFSVRLKTFWVLGYLTEYTVNTDKTARMHKLIRLRCGYNLVGNVSMS